jgi:hypothetical protein
VQRLDDNVLTLDSAHWRLGDGDWLSRAAPAIAIQKQLNDAHFDGPLTLRYAAHVRQLDAQRRVHVVVEYPERYQIAVNGRQVRYAGLPPWRDMRWLPIDITGMLMAGENAIELRCDNFQYGDLASVKDQFRRYGTEIESIYLVGDFSVETTLRPAEQPVSPLWKQWGLPPIGVRCFEPDMRLTDPSPLTFGDVTSQGLPFYAGRIQLTARLPDIPAGAGATLRVERLDAAVAEVAVDGASCGYLMSHPLEVPIRAGREITITLYGTLRNLLGPHHHIEGELPAVGPDSFLPRFAAELSADGWLNRWLAGELHADNWSDRYCMVTFGDLGRVHVNLKR